MDKCLNSSDRMDWETPSYVFDRLNDEFEFDIDVCAYPHNAKCAKYYTEEDDALSKSWNGVCWMNPPYGRDIKHWIKKAYEQSLNGSIVVCLIPSRTDTKYWHEYVMKASEIRLIKGRIKFVGAEHPAPFPNAIVVFENHYDGLKLTGYDL